jgi:hypothetical protein
MVKVGYSSQLLARKTGRAFKVVRLSSWHRVLSRVKFGIFFALGSFYERRAVNDGLYRYLMEYCQREGVKEYGDKQR